MEPTLIINSRRDGSPFMNLLMTAPLLDSRGVLRYFIGAQIDVSGLVKDSTDLDAFQRMLDEEEGHAQPGEAKDEFQELSEMFNHGELDTVRRFGGNMHRDHVADQGDKSNAVQRPRLLIQDQSMMDVETAEKPLPKPEGRLSGPYKHVRQASPISLAIVLTQYSISSFALRPRFASYSHLPRSESPGSCSHTSSTESAVPCAYENQSATPFLMVRAA